MVVNTFGGAALIEKGIFKDITNHVSDRDWVPRSKTGEFNDHSWDGATYQEALADVNETFKNKFIGVKS